MALTLPTIIRLHDPTGGLPESLTLHLSEVLNSEEPDWKAASDAWSDLQMRTVGTDLAGAVHRLGELVDERDLEACRAITSAIKDTIAFGRRFHGLPAPASNA